MDVFDFRDQLVKEYEGFSRSFTKIKARDILDKVNAEYEAGRFWPDPLIQLNPNFESGGFVDDLVAGQKLHNECAKIFRIKRSDNTVGEPLELHRHQTDAIEISKRDESYVLTTGTGSGKSLAYFVPIIHDVLRRKESRDHLKGITAIVVYPTNALCNSQREELERFLCIGYESGREPVTFARYTGQVSNEERERIAKHPPDILLTNYVMLEWLMTRFNEVDKALREHASGLKFLVLDEMHTYRGRQGADVAMLVRRVRERFNPRMLCVGTSATMASEGTLEERNAVVADVATRLFGDSVRPSNIVSETLRSATEYGSSPTRKELRTAIQQGVPSDPSHEALERHPVAAWVEYNLGLEEQDGRLVRITSPLTLRAASERLAEDSESDPAVCQEYLQEFLLASHRSLDARGRGFFAFRLHQFVSGAWNVYSTLECETERYLTLDGQQFQPGHRNRPLYTVSFCRGCGQEYLPVWANLENKRAVGFDSRDLTERSNDDPDVQYGYLMPDHLGRFNGEDLQQFPDEWLDPNSPTIKLKVNYRKYQPMHVQVNTEGVSDPNGLKAWFIPGAFRFCLNPDCEVYFDGSVKSELSKLSGLSSEGRSSATTVLALSALKHLIGTDLDEKTKKILAFTDNRQDASLQAGHFNDFIQILLLRSALIAAIDASSEKQLNDDDLAGSVLDCLGLEPEDYASNPHAKGPSAENTRRALRDVLGYRLYFDLQRGWRITNPNLEQLRLLRIKYDALEMCCGDEDEWAKCHPLLASASPEVRFKLAEDLLDRMRKALCIKTVYLEQSKQEGFQNRSHALLKEPWALSDNERPFANAWMVPRPKRKNMSVAVHTHHISHGSVFGRKIKPKAYWESNGSIPSAYPSKFNEDVYNRIIDDVLGVLSTYGHIESEELTSGITGYYINASVLRWCVEGNTTERETSTNRFFRDLYKNVASLLDTSDRSLHQLEAREHTAQVDSDEREKREERFRKGLEKAMVVEGESEPRGLPILFCSPTMELGVDISTLNAVYMRNVPPTPANYAQRSGRAGRSGQPALVITYCAARAPHDQYFFSEPTRMVSGIANPPNIDLANEDLVRSHLQAVWLGETGVKLGDSVREVLNVENASDLPIYEHIESQLRADRVANNAYGRSVRILRTLENDLDQHTAPWFTENWIESAVNSAPYKFDQAFIRWRSLFQAATTQMRRAHDISMNAAAKEKDRLEASRRYKEAETQRNLLLDSKTFMNSDFYTYRYLGAEGFIPGYNFPRLPLVAFVPGRRNNAGRDAFLSRPRFLGLSEFGPLSIIYHEGSTYKVRYASLSVREGEKGVDVSSRLPVRTARLCPMCGYGHFGDQMEYERCVSCDGLLENGHTLSNLYRIEQVSTQRVDRITSDEEERQRQGYDLVTTYRHSEKNGRRRVMSIALEEGGEVLAELRYGPSAMLWRMNLGWRRRKAKSIYGFCIDTNTGEWSKDSQAPTDVEDDSMIDQETVERITPFVEDSKNILILQPHIPLDEETMVSLQYAIKRGIEQEFQLEEAELAAEPLPERTNRRTILFYEASEGGAGVLTRLVSDLEAFKRVAGRALEVCHYESISGRWSGVDDLKNLETECEAGCYRCLLSYYNQQEHGLIDRRHPDMLSVLARFVRCSQTRVEDEMNVDRDNYEALNNISSSSLEKEWLRFVESNGYHLPDKAQPLLEGSKTRPDFMYTDTQVLIYIDGPHHHTEIQKADDEAINLRLASDGFTVLRFGVDRSTWPEIMTEYSWVFGTGSPE